MKREWKPGDVARTAGGKFVAFRTDEHWYFHDDSSTSTFGEDVAGFRPLAVIDPEDREQVERLAKTMHESDHIAPWHDLHNETRSQIEGAMQAALREFANPRDPKPDEPTGLGAVIEDAEGADWHRTRDGRWIAEDGLRSRACGWGHIDAVRVLSEGVAPDA